jgi:hypothetical protein
MNRDAEAINQFLAWLTQLPDPAILSSGAISNPFADLEISGSVDLPIDRDPLDSEVEAMQADMQAELPEFDFYVEDVSSLELGEIPAVQDRFHTIIKRRLRAEIERNPPLFPWEATLLDYEDQPVARSLWTAQLQVLKLPVAVPETLMLQIFAECRKLADSSLKQGVKLVRAVEGLFPEELPNLNYWATQVLMEPARSSATLAATDLPASYEQANSTQQMVLSLLAAQQVLAAMTLELSPARPQADQRWMTESGELVISADYQTEGRLRIQAELPMAGRLTLNGEANQATAVCAEPETLTVELGLLPGTYSLEISLKELDSLTFTILLGDD